MGLVDKIKNGLTAIKEDITFAGGNWAGLPIIDPSTFRGFGESDYDGGMWFFGDGSKEIRPFTYINKQSPVLAYNLCPPVSAIINRKTQAFSNGNTTLTNIAGKAKGKESDGLFATKIRTLLNQPNRIQSGSQFEAQLYAMVQLYGWALVMPMIPYGFTEISDATALWILPNWLIDIYYSTSLFFDQNSQIINRITITYGGRVVELPIENMMLIKDLTPVLSNPIIPNSRILSLEKPINNVIGAYDSRNTLINKRGPMGFITQTPDANGLMPLTAKEKRELQREFMNYGLRRDQLQVVLAGMRNLKFESMGYNTKDLMLMEEVSESGIAISTGLSYPPFLLGLSDTTYNNQKEASRGLYMESIIPESANIYQQLGNYFKTTQNGIQIGKNYDHVSALQEDRLNTAQADKLTADLTEKQFKNNWITLDQARVLNCLDPVGDAFGKLYYKDLIALGWNFGNTGIQAGDTNSTTPPDVGTTQPAKVVNMR
jgi:hypothetical protein